jgi:poly-gamma-glutamate capsule biosynthesis protein CapA/YwtB (metallophosphatase superfamily)
LKELKILFVGDYCPIGRNKNLIEKNIYSGVFGDFKLLTSQADFCIANMEAPLTKSNTAIEKTGPNIKVPTSFLKPLKELGFDAVTLANNHIMDYGEDGIKSTINVCEREGIRFVGAGENIIKARQPLLLNLNDRKIAIINIAENEFCAAETDQYGANPLNVITNHYDIQKAKKENDYVIVISHGGREHYQLPSPNLRERHRFFIDSGADAVIGHHTHCFSGFEYYSEKPIFYSLGNFIFDYKEKYQKGLWTQGYGLMLKIVGKNIDFDLIPFNQGRKIKSKLEFLTKKERIIFDAKIVELNSIIANDELFKIAWINYIKTQKKTYHSNLFIQNKYIRALISRGLLPAFFFHSKKHKTLLLNMFRCESHREIMIEVLKSK